MSISENLIDYIFEAVPDGKGPVAIHMLLIRQAMAARGEVQDMTASTKLSLEVYERSAVFRALKDLFSQGLLEFLDTAGNPIVPTEKEIAMAAAGEKDVKFRAVRLTQRALDRRS